MRSGSAGEHAQLEQFLNGPWDAQNVNCKLNPETEALVAEIARYLSIVDAFRSLDCEPTWRPEPYRDANPRSGSVTPGRIPSEIKLH